jgi:hypothetical protein
VRQGGFATGFQLAALRLDTAASSAGLWFTQSAAHRGGCLNKDFLFSDEMLGVTDVMGIHGVDFLQDDHFLS